jgi:hypothetical protein
VTLLVHRWDEDWSRLAWLRLYGTADLLEPGSAERPEHTTAIAALRARYPQYGTHELEARPLIRIRAGRAVRWAADER